MRKERNSGPAEADGSKARGEKVNCIRVLCTVKTKYLTWTIQLKAKSPVFRLCSVQTN